MDNADAIKTIHFKDGSTRTARRRVYPHAQLSQFRVHASNKRIQSSLDSYAVSDILPSIIEKGVSEEIYTFAEDGTIWIIEGSRRTVSARIAGQDIPGWEFVEALTSAQVAELSQESDEKRLHSARENALALFEYIDIQSIASIKDLFAAKGVSNTDTNRKRYRRTMDAGLIPTCLYELFLDRETLKQTQLSSLYSAMLNALPENTRSELINHRRKFEFNSFLDLAQYEMTLFLEPFDDEQITDFSKPNMVARKVIDCIQSLKSLKKFTIEQSDLEEAFSLLQSIEDKEDGGKQSNLRACIIDIARAKLGMAEGMDHVSYEYDRLNSMSTSWLEMNRQTGIIKLIEKDLSNIALAYNKDRLRQLETLLQPKQTVDPDSKKQRPNDTTASKTQTKKVLFKSGDTIIHLSQNKSDESTLDISCKQLPRDIAEKLEAFIATL
ncbi:hypothetical protein [Vibrio mediterranei]|uniref:hypothetical protein n=1 Tax=Vibrio mediterranei TaxID=689 RepID=UPI004068D454